MMHRSDRSAEQPPVASASNFWTKRRLIIAVGSLLTLHYVLAASSLLLENPTVDEVVHLPAGVSYWQKGTFRLYHHNPPLVKLVAALPVVMMHPRLEAAYSSPTGWLSEYPAQARFGEYFLALNVDRYFAMFSAARLVMPVWSVLGGLVVFGWARRLYGSWGGLLSLSLWCFCPNVLAHGRLITSDLAAAAVGCAATYTFWRYLQAPSWRRALLAGLALGVAQLVKFSMLLLYPIWPVLWLIQRVGRREQVQGQRWLATEALQGVAIVALSVLVIDCGYLFEGVGTPVGSFPFASRGLLTRPGEEPRWRTRPSGNPLIDISWRHVVNRARGTALGSLPSPLPKHFLLGFDEQKIDADGIPAGWFDPNAPDPDRVTGYPVYLDGVLRRTGWRTYYLMTILYKVPEGTWFMVVLAAVVTAIASRRRGSLRDEVTLLVIPGVVMLAMSFLTDINIGLRYVLPIFPYMFIFCGKLPRWAISLSGSWRRVAIASVAGGLAATVVATASSHPHYLSYFNRASGGPERGSEHLIDSNLDWGQDLVGLARWVRGRNVSGPVGVAYFGQLSPTVLQMTGDGFEWFLPPIIEGRMKRETGPKTPRIGPAPRLTPGIYAVSATMLRGLPWRIYDPIDPRLAPEAWLGPSGNATEDAFAYFRELTPLPETIGHSIFLYRVTEADAERINAKYRFERR